MRTQRVVLILKNEIPSFLVTSGVRHQRSISMRATKRENLIIPLENDYSYGYSTYLNMQKRELHYTKSKKGHV